jgi:predicted esterase
VRDAIEPGIGSLLVETPTHGRVLWRDAVVRPCRGIVVGFHGYAENAAVQMERLVGIAGAEAWILAAAQALHRFYRSRSEVVVASWMTREDREAAIADNVGYIDRVVDAVAGNGALTEPAVVYVGFSQGAAMAFRAGVRGGARCAGVLAVGGDVPPDLLEDSSAIFPPVVLMRGVQDEWYTAAKFSADVAALEARGVRLRAIHDAGGHEWNAAAASAAADLLAAVQ